MSRDPNQSASPQDPARFDEYAKDYVSLHAKSVEAAGEQPEYFARYKLDRLERLLGPGMVNMRVLDYGCGVGMLTRQMVGHFGEVHGYDPSAGSLSKAREEVAGATFHGTTGELPDGEFDLAILSGVLHHVPPHDRGIVLGRVRRVLRPGSGRVVVFEHNPLNPLTRRAVAMCPFDDDAVLIGPREATGLLRRGGFQDVTREFIVFFPRQLSFLRGLEPRLGWLPVGAQMMLVGRRGH